MLDTEDCREEEGKMRERQERERKRDGEREAVKQRCRHIFTLSQHTLLFTEHSIHVSVKRGMKNVARNKRCRREQGSECTHTHSCATREAR